MIRFTCSIHFALCLIKLFSLGVFLLPYFITLFICGIPLLFMELAIGQFFGRGVIGAVGQCCPLFKGISIRMRKCEVINNFFTPITQIQGFDWLYEYKLVSLFIIQNVCFLINISEQYLVIYLIIQKYLVCTQLMNSNQYFLICIWLWIKSQFK